MLDLYKMPRKELQALCKQHSLPANKTNVAMADALSACLSNGFQKVESTKRKATAKSNFLGVTKTTIMKARVEKRSEIRETSLASLILSGTLKSSSAKRSEKPSLRSTERVLGFPQPNTTPLRRGLKKTERQLHTIPEEKCNLATENKVSVTRSNMLGCKAAKRPSREIGGMTKEATKSRKTSPLADISAGINVSSAERPVFKASGVAAALLPSNGPQEADKEQLEFKFGVFHNELPGAERNEGQVIICDVVGKSIKPEQNLVPMRLEVENLDVYKELLGGDPVQVGSISSAQSVTQTVSQYEEPGKSEFEETQQLLEMERNSPEAFDVKTARTTPDTKHGCAGEEANKVFQGSPQLESLKPATELLVTNTALHEELLGIRDSKLKTQMEDLEMSSTADVWDIIQDIIRKQDDSETKLDCEGLMEMESILPDKSDWGSTLETFEDLLSKQRSNSMAKVDSVTLIQTETVLPEAFDAQTATRDSKSSCVGEDGKEVVQDSAEIKSMEPAEELVVRNSALHMELLGLTDNNGSAGKDCDSAREPHIQGLAQIESSPTSSTVNAINMFSVPNQILSAPAGISPLSKIQQQLDATIAKASGMLSKYAEWKAERAHRKIGENSSEPEVANTRNETSGELKQPIAGEMLVLDSTSEKERQILGGTFEAAQLVHKDSSQHKDLEHTTLPKLRAHCKDRKKQKPGVLKDIPLNVRLPKSKETPLGCTDKENPGHKGVKDLSLRKLRAHCKEEKVKALLRQSCIN